MINMESAAGKLEESWSEEWSGRPYVRFLGLVWGGSRATTLFEIKRPEL